MRIPPILRAVIVVGLALPLNDAWGQVRNARSTDYLLITDVSDVRALWVNPAGLAIFPEASLMGEAVVERLPGDDLRLAQFTFGINSRGFGVGYQRDRFDGGPSSNVLRLGTGIPFSRGALGVALSWYGVEGPNSRDGDVGVIYGLSRMMTLGFTLRHIGRATIADVKMPLTFTGAGHLGLLQGRLQLAAQAQATETVDPNNSDYDVSFVGAGRFILPTRRRITFLATALVTSDFDLDRLHIGVAIGGRSNVGLVGTAIKRDGTLTLDRLSATGVASNPLPGR
jgi:hypothetical protein